MTPENFAAAMTELSFIEDKERRHGAMDDLLCKLLSELGYQDGVDVFNRVDKWYS